MSGFVFPAVRLAATIAMCVTLFPCPSFGADPESDYLDLSPGDHEISAQFGYEVRGGRSAPGSIVIYHVRDVGSGEKEPLGALGVDGIVIHDRSRPSAFAVSEDGKTLLYVHWQYPYLSGSLKDKPQGLYEYVHERGDRLIRAGVRPVWAREKLPNDAIRFGEASGRDETYVRRTSGEEYLEGDPTWTALYRAAYLGQVAEIERLLAAGEEVDRSDGFGYTPLHVAVRNGHEEAVRVLLDHGADPNTRLNPSTSMITPMHDAAFGSPSMIALLLSKGVDIDSRTGAGDTPLHLAVWYEKCEGVANLVNQGADVNAKNKEGNTPLHVFAGDFLRDERSAEEWNAGDNEKLVKLLLSSGAQVDARNDQNQTPLQLAVEQNNIRTAQILVASGADAGLTELTKPARGKRLTLRERIAEILESRFWKTPKRE
ncbi:MAG: ankyrin repeat domain-containing protein [Gammaproteobacteria bacterium]